MWNTIGWFNCNNVYAWQTWPYMVAPQRNDVIFDDAIIEAGCSDNWGVHIKGVWISKGLLCSVSHQQRELQTLLLVAVSLWQAKLNDIFMPWFTHSCLTGRKDRRALFGVSLHPRHSHSYCKLVMFQFYIDRAGPDPSTFPVVRSMWELWLTLCATVGPRAACAATLLTLE